MKINHVSVGASDMIGYDGMYEKWSPIYIHRDDNKKEVRSYNIKRSLAIRRAILVLKAFMDMLSFEEELYLKSLFPVQQSDSK